MTAGIEIDSVSLKVFYNNEIRRLPYSESNPTFDGLCALLGKIFDLEPTAIVVKYLDSDGDKVTMSTDGELKEAIKSTKEATLLRMFIDVKPAPQEKVQPHVDLRGPMMLLPHRLRAFPRGAPIRVRAVSPRVAPPSPSISTPPAVSEPAPPADVSSTESPVPVVGNEGDNEVKEGEKDEKEGEKDEKEGEKDEKEGEKGEKEGEKEGEREPQHKILKERLCAMRQLLQLVKANAASSPEDKRIINEKIKQMNEECKKIKIQMISECQKEKEERKKAKEARIAERKVKQEMVRNTLQQARLIPKSSAKAKPSAEANVTPAAC